MTHLPLLRYATFCSASYKCINDSASYPKFSYKSVLWILEMQGQERFFKSFSEPECVENVCWEEVLKITWLLEMSCDYDFIVG